MKSRRSNGSGASGGRSRFWRTVTSWAPRLVVGVVVLALASTRAPIADVHASASPTLAVTAAALVDVERGQLVSDAIVTIAGDRILESGSRQRIRLPDGVRRIDLGNAIMLPGLVDAHVHLTLRGEPEENARATLMAGFTTVQDLGSLNYAALALRDAIRDGRVVGPRVVAAGPWLGISGGTCDFNGIGVRGPDAFRARVREDVERGVDLIKVCVSGWLADAAASPDKYEISFDELREAIAEAHRLERRVAVHALSAAGIEAAVRLGADLIVHAGFTPAGTVDQMKARGALQVSTLSSLVQAGPAGPFAALQKHLASAVTNGLPLAFGTDAGVIAHGENAREFESLAAIGMTPADALRAATTHAARAVGLGGQIGTVAAGAVADLVAVDGNPLADRSALRRVAFVMKAGRVYHGPGQGGDASPRLR